MKVIILAGGYGSRLGQHTEWIPKPMVEIGGKPMIWHIMKIYAQSGFNDFIISAGVKAYSIKHYFLNYESYSNNFTRDFENGTIEFHLDDNAIDWKVSVIDTGLNAKKGARIKRVEKFLSAENNMVTYGDGVADLNIQDLLAFHNSHSKLVTVTGVHPPARFGEIVESSGAVSDFSEKSQTSTGLINGGFMIFRREFLNYLSPEDDCDLESGTLEYLASKGEVMVYKHLGSWECVDHERDLQKLNDLWSSSRAFWKIW